MNIANYRLTILLLRSHTSHPIPNQAERIAAEKAKVGVEALCAHVARGLKQLSNHIWTLFALKRCVHHRYKRL